MGISEGPSVGSSVGERVGRNDGKSVGSTDGTRLGIDDGESDGTIVGTNVGTYDETTVGTYDGTSVGTYDGLLVGTSEGSLVDIKGTLDGILEGETVHGQIQQVVVQISLARGYTPSVSSFRQSCFCLNVLFPCNHSQVLMTETVSLFESVLYSRKNSKSICSRTEQSSSQVDGAGVGRTVVATALRWSIANNSSI